MDVNAKPNLTADDLAAHAGRVVAISKLTGRILSVDDTADKLRNKMETRGWKPNDWIPFCCPKVEG